MRLVEIIYFEAFRPTLNRVHQKARKDASGRKPWDVVLMFKVLILRTLYNLSDSQLVDSLLDRFNRNAAVFGDSAYRSQAISRQLKELGYRNCILEKTYRNRPLTERQIARNRKKVCIRVRVEHVFGRQAQCLGGTLLRCIGHMRAARCPACGF